MRSDAEQPVDVIVVGMGAAGAAAALSAHEQGATVLVVEKCDPATAGGNTRISGGAWFINQNVASARRYLQSLCGEFPIPEDVIAAWAEETAKNSDWMRDLGADVRPTPENFAGPEYTELDGSDCYAGMHAINGQMGNFLLYNFFVQALAERNIEVRFGTAARRLVTTPENNSVSGIVVDSGNGEYEIQANGGVILATGGFEANPDMVRTYLRLADPPLWGSPAATGDGHRMAQAVGADLWHMNNMATNTGFKPDNDDTAGFYLALWAAHNYLFIGTDGRRLTDETALPRHGHVFLNGRYEHFPLHSMLVVFDEQMRQAGPLSLSPAALPVGWGALMNGYCWSEDNTAEIDQGWIKQAQSLPALAAAINIDPQVLKRTVENYNDACKRGVDDAFGRDSATLAPICKPPFYAIICSPLLGWSNGGPRRDGRARVLDTAGDWIEGLYAAGNLSSTYSACKDGGFHIADALAFGRIAGHEAAAQSA